MCLLCVIEKEGKRQERNTERDKCIRNSLLLIVCFGARVIASRQSPVMNVTNGFRNDLNTVENYELGPDASEPT